MKTKRYFLFVIGVIVSMTALGSGLAASSQEGDPIGRITELKRDITLLNLLNGLHLTSEQESALLEDARNAQKITASYRRSFGQLFPDAEKSLEDLKAHLLRGEAAPGSAFEESAKRANDELKRMREAYIRELAVVERHASTNLTDGQKEIVADFKPCLVPPKNLKNPTRAGQAKDLSGVETMLARARTMPADVYESRIDTMLERRMAKYEEHLDSVVTKDVHESEKARIRSLVDEARAMSDVDFELNKQDLAQRIGLLSNKGREGSLLTRGERRGRISAFLLDERIVALLEQRIAASGRVQAPASALATIKPAEDCRLECGSKK